MSSSLPSIRSKDKQTWSLDIRIMAKWFVLIGILLYARWAVKTYVEFDGIFKIGDDRVIGGDFINNWSAARLALSHHIMTLFDLDSYHKAQTILFGHAISEPFNWSYPPFFIPYILWLGFFSYPVALILWLTVTFALYAFAVVYKRPMPYGLFLALALAPSSYANIDIGQNGFLSAALLVGGLRLLSVRPTLAGICLGLLSYKPQLGLLIPIALLAAREWRVFTVAILTILVLVGGSVLLFGLEPWQAYLHVTLPYQQLIILEADPHIFFTRMSPTCFMAMRILGAGLPISYAVAAVTALGSVLVVLYAFTRCQSPDLRNAVLLTAIFLTSPYIYFYDMTILTAGIISMAAAAGPRIKPYSLFVLSAAWFMPVFVFPINKTGIPLCPLITAALLGLQLYMIKSRPEFSNPDDRDAQRLFAARDRAAPEA